MALYFSRSPVPYPRDGEKARYFGHIGLYCYRREALLRFASLKPAPLEEAEKLEQLRALENGMSIVCVEVPSAAPGIDTPEDLARAEEILARRVKEWQGLRGLTPILKEVLLWVKCYQISLHATEKPFFKGRVN